MSLDSFYHPVGIIRGQHMETVVPGLFRKVTYDCSQSETIPTPDDDFLELDWYHGSSDNLVICSHGLEGNSTRSYMKGMSRVFHQQGYSVLCWNFRGCGDTLNKKPRLYHSGATDDLDTVVQYAIGKEFKNITLIGFSLGGNLTLKYVGERSISINSQIKAAVAFSTPLDLDAGCTQLSVNGNKMYSNRFLRKLKKKVRLKHEQFPDVISLNGINQIKDLRTFDDHYTAPIHGFKDAKEYYAKCSSIKFINTISIPTLIVNAINDPFLPDECYPYELMESNPNILFEAPNHGGHVGFMRLNSNGRYWSEERALSFINNLKIN